MQVLERDGYTRQQVIDALHGKHGSRLIKFSYNLLDKDDNYLTSLSNVTGGEVSLSFQKYIKRTAKLKLKDLPVTVDGQSREINYLSDKIKIFCSVRMHDGGFTTFSLGVFLLSSPVKKEENGDIYREVECYDGLVILKDDRFSDRYYIPAGTNYRTAVIDILTSAGITKHNIDQTDKTLDTAIEFGVGREKLFAINELLREINYTPIHVDVEGYFTSFPYVNPARRGVEYTYEDNSISVMYDGVENELDLFSIPNKWIVVRTNNEQKPIHSIYTNSNADSPTSTVNRGRTIVDYRETERSADQVTLDAYTERIAFEASQVYGSVRFQTAIMPFHDYSDMYTINYSPLSINDKYHEMEWTIPLEAGARMEHVARKVVNI